MTSSLIERIRRSVIGDDQVMHGAVRAAPGDLRRLHRLRRALAFIEDFIRDEVLPRYANTHTESSGTGLQTTRLREDARADHPRRRRRRRRDRGDLRRLRLHRRDRQADRRSSACGSRRRSTTATT